MKKKIIVIFTLLFSLSVCSSQIVQISIPKCGTNLLAKCIHLLTGQSHVASLPGISLPCSFYYLSPTHLQKMLNLPSNTFWTTHLMYSQDHATILQNNDCRIFFIYRDPRDQIVSFMHYVRKSEAYWLDTRNMSDNELITKMIVNGVSDIHPPAQGIVDLYDQYLGWLNLEDICLIRFEDLVGENGGGSSELQWKLVKKIAHHIGLLITEKKAQEIAGQLFGGTGTFRKGQIGAWKNYFTEEHKKLFKDAAGNLLIHIGYEKTLDW